MVEKAKKFECKSCGACCEKFGEKGLPLFEFEVEHLKKISGEKNLDIRPTEIFLDKISEKKFAVLYGLFNQPCIFLDKNKKCKIYEERFLICKQFPVFSTPKFRFAKKENEPKFFECKCFDCKKHFSEKKLNEKELQEFYGDCYKSALESNKETERIMKILIDLQKRKIIDIEGISFEESINFDEVIGLSEFLKDIKEN
jgi:Fe-S-cluster containining protein